MVMITNSFDKFPNEPTGLMYEQFGKIGLNPATAPKYETDTFATGWEQNTTGTQNIAVANSRVEYDVTDSGTQQSTLVYDLGTANISETAWVLRGKCVIDNYSSGSGSSCHFFCGLSNGDKTVAFDGNQNSISFAVGVGTADTAYYLGSSVNGAMYSMTSQVSGNITHTPTAETVYFEIIRNNATSATITLYTDSTYTTSPSGYSRTLTLSSAPTGLRYLVFKSRDRDISGNSLDGNIDDIKFYNGVTSVESASPKVKQHFIEYFSGKQLPSYWDKSNTNGTQAMADAVDGGLLMSTTSSGSSISYIDFADKKQFSNTGSVMISVMKHGSTTGGESYTGLQSGTTQGNGQGAWSYVNDAWKGAVFNLYTVGASGGTWVQTGCVTSDTNWHIHKIELTSSAGSLQIDGNTTVTSTTNLPTVSLQPSVGINNSSAVNRTLNIRYMECYNT